jgi:hypothetical protein
VLGLWAIRPCAKELSETCAAGKRATARRPNGPRVGMSSTLKRIERVPRDQPLWIDLQMHIGNVPALVDIGTQFSCIRSDLAEFAYLMGELCLFKLCSVTCSLADGRKCKVSDAMDLHVKLLSFSWNHEFKLLNGGSFLVNLGSYFLEQTKMIVDVASCKFFFAFAPQSKGSFGAPVDGGDGSPICRNYDRKLRNYPPCWRAHRVIRIVVQN